MNTNHLNDLLTIDLECDVPVQELIRTYTIKAVQYAYRDTKTHIPRNCDYDRAIRVLKKYYSKVKT